jgi:solute carrier family 25 citrate transporter 1
VVYPLDSLKVLKQSNQYTSLPKLLVQPRFLYKGFNPFLSQMFVKYGLRFTTFEMLKSKHGNFVQNFGAGVVAGISEASFITPFELIKTNLQTTQNKKPVEVIKNLYNANGIKGLYRGFSSTCIRQSTNQAFNFSVYYKLREFFVKENEKPSMYKIILSSLFSSSIGPILTSPVDTIKTRFMNPHFKYKNVLEAFRDILKNEGFSAFYKGLGFRLMRVSGGQVICFSVVEHLMHVSVTNGSPV